MAIPEEVSAFFNKETPNDHGILIHLIGTYEETSRIAVAEFEGRKLAVAERGEMPGHVTFTVDLAAVTALYPQVTHIAFMNTW